MPRSPTAHATHKPLIIDANAREQIPSPPVPLSLSATSNTFPFLSFPIPPSTNG
ncbi:hypothetical protein BJV74DRAFT_874573 [Russula compacta]|nr:hypothetical protein BJV74DRAFT_874573 [Russula compacta]